MAKILLVEDHEPTAELIQMVLKPRGYEIVHTTDGSKAFELARTFMPELILLDVMLPGLDGYGIQTKLLEDEATRKIPILITTSKLHVQEIFNTAPNVVGYVSKPFSVKELIQQIENVLQGSKSRPA